jgi:hypothetical protein
MDSHLSVADPILLVSLILLKPLLAFGQGHFCCKWFTHKLLEAVASFTAMTDNLIKISLKIKHLAAFFTKIRRGFSGKVHVDEL